MLRYILMRLAIVIVTAAVCLAPAAIASYEVWTKASCTLSKQIQPHWQELVTGKCPSGYVIVKYKPSH